MADLFGHEPRGQRELELGGVRSCRKRVPDLSPREGAHFAELARVAGVLSGRLGDRGDWRAARTRADALTLSDENPSMGAAEKRAAAMRVESIARETGKR